jgi:hypothetical protein
MLNTVVYGLTGTAIGLLLGGPSGAICMGMGMLLFGAIADASSSSNLQARRKSAIASLPANPSDRQIARALKDNGLCSFEFVRKESFPVDNARFQSMKSIKVERES